MQIDKADPLLPLKSSLLVETGIRNPHSIPWIITPLDTCLSAARALVLSEEEAYYVRAGTSALAACISPRNEAAALNLLLTHRQQVCAPKDEARLQGLLDLAAGFPQRAGCPEAQLQPAQQPAAPQPFSADTPEGRLQAWAAAAGATSAVSAAIFPSGLRGAVADRDIAAGECVMTVPSSLLISYETAKSSDFGKCLARIPGLDDESLAVVWTMVDRWDDESPHAPFWASLPSAIGTGLSADDAAIAVLKVRQAVGSDGRLLLRANTF